MVGFGSNPFAFHIDSWETLNSEAMEASSSLITTGYVTKYLTSILVSFSSGQEHLTGTRMVDDPLEWLFRLSSVIGFVKPWKVLQAMDEASVGWEKTNWTGEMEMFPWQSQLMGMRTSR